MMIGVFAVSTCWRSHAHSCAPLISGMWRSVTIKWGFQSSTALRNLRSELTARTSKPASSSTRDATASWISLSSIITMRCVVSPMSHRDQLAKGFDDAAQPDRFVEERRRAGTQRRVASSIAATRHRNHGHPRVCQRGADLPDQPGAIEHRQVDVDDHGIELLALEQLERCAAVRRGIE